MFQDWLDDHQERLAAPLMAIRDKEYKTLILGLIDTSRVIMASHAIDRLLDFTHHTGHARLEVDMLLLRVLVLQQQGELPLAHKVLSRAIELAAPMGYVSIFLELGPTIAALLREVYRYSSVPSHIERLLAGFFDVDKVTEGLGNRVNTDDDQTLTLSPPHPVTSSLIEPLTSREIEVLGLIATGASNAVIAQRLIVSLGTVKKHTANIFGKLQVQSRTQAVARARELGLL
jgi:LuxR family transcriptional regulator, maltose regulon positive regulatory protein